MNVDRSPDQPVSAATWEHRQMREALAQRDLATVYRRLQSAGVSQRRIAALTGQSPSEVYEILRGRQVMAYDVLLRIADGLGVPRGYMGLAYDQSTEWTLDLAAATCSQNADEREEVRELLSRAANVTMGAAVSEIAKWWQPVEAAHTPVLTRVGLSDVLNIESLTSAMRMLDCRYGGGACREAVVAQVRWAQLLLTADYGDDVARRLHVALADLHRLAAWTSFDVGLYSAARRHFARALEQARHSNDFSLVANVLYCVGRLHLHRGYFRDALKFFQLGQIAAQDSGSELTVALLCANEAWAYALLDDSSQAIKSIGRAQDEFARADRGTGPAWTRFFGTADLYAMTGVVYGAIPGRNPRYLEQATENLERCLEIRGDDQARSRTFEVTALATTHLRLDNRDEGVRLGHQAVDLAAQIRSVRTLDRLAPLQEEAHEHGADPDARDLAERIARLRTV